MDSASQGTCPTASPVQLISGTKNASPQTNPTRAFHRALSRRMARYSRAMPTKTVPHQPGAGKASRVR